MRIEDEHHSECPSTTGTDHNIQLIRRTLDHRMTTDELSERTGISEIPFQQIID